MNRIVDFHTHILPKMDDGSRSVEMSVEMLREEFRQGVKTVVLTPHFYANHDKPERFLERRTASFERLCGAIGDEQDLPRLVLGAEVHYFDGISDCEYLDKFVVEGTNCILIEMPTRQWDERLLVEMASIYPKRRLIPVIAHVDRYLPRIGGGKVFERLASLPVMIQVNAEFFSNFSTKRLALRMLSEGKIHLIGSDCHNMKTRKPDIESALNVIKRKSYERYLEAVYASQNKLICE